jgi:hypothetical protein
VRTYSGAVYNNNHIYIAGGFRGGRMCKFVDIYNVRLKKWSCAPDMINVRGLSHVAVSLIGSSNPDRIMVIGTSDTGKSEIYDINEKNGPWHHPSMNREAACGTTYNGRVYIFGGHIDGGSAYTQSCLIHH